MINDAGGESESWLLWLVNRVVRCSHRRHSRPITPRGGGQSYAVCLDCGTRIAYDLNAMRVETSVPGSSVNRPTSDRGKERVLDIPEDGPMPSAVAHWVRMWDDLGWPRRNFGTVVVVCLGVMSLAVALLYSPNRPAGAKHLSTAGPSPPADSVKSLPSFPVQESGTE